MRRDFLRILEAGIVGLFLVQSIRFLYAALHAHLSSADQVRRVGYAAVAHLPGAIDVPEVQREVLAVAATLLAPLLAVLLARTRWSIPLAVALVAVGRSMTLQVPDSQVLAAAVVVAAGLFYMTLIAIRRPRYFPIMLILGFAGDQVIRAMNSTADPSFNPNAVLPLSGGDSVPLDTAMIGIAIFMLLLTSLTTIIEREESRMPDYEPPRPGVLTGWGALALGGILFLEFTLLGLPNAAAHWAGIDYYVMLPLILTATTLPLVPEVRARAGQFLGLFDGAFRGWLWALMLVLLLILGRRFEGIPSAAALTGAQFVALLAVWWMVRQPEERPRLNPTPVLVLVGVVVFVLLSMGDYFTYYYAYVRPLEPPFEFLEEFMLGMRDMGLPLMIIAAILTCMPMILERQTIPWRNAKILETLWTLAAVVLVTLWATREAVPSPLRLPLRPNCLRVASLNIESGFTPYFSSNLEDAAQLILDSGADIVLLQEVDGGLLSSGSVDQALWLANRTNMNLTFYPLNERLQGLAVLSRLSAADAEGFQFESTGAQAGVQHVQYNIDESGNIHVYNVWLNYSQAALDGESLPTELQDQRRQEQQLYTLIAQNHFPNPNVLPTERVILGGSFNFADEGDTADMYNKWNNTDFMDPLETLYEEDTNTFFMIDGRAARWDYLWLLNLANNNSDIVKDTHISKRRMVVVEIGREANQMCPAQ